MYFFHLRSLYESKKTRERQSNLKKSLNSIQANIDTAVLQIEEASKLKINPAVGVDRLAQTCIRKQQLLTSIGQSLLALKAQVSSGDVLNSLRRRVKQQSSKDDDYSVVCSNLPEFTWEIAFRALEDQQNSGLNIFPLQFADLRSVAYHSVYTVCYYSCHDDYQFRKYTCKHTTVLSNIQGYWNAVRRLISTPSHTSNEVCPKSVCCCRCYASAC